MKVIAQGDPVEYEIEDAADACRLYRDDMTKALIGISTHLTDHERARRAFQERDRALSERDFARKLVIDLVVFGSAAIEEDDEENRAMATDVFRAAINQARKFLKVLEEPAAPASAARTEEATQMHDPMTVAFEIRRPWSEKRKLPGGPRYFPSLITVWHVDPETDGSDDSCDWFGRHLSEKAKALADEMASWEESFPYYFTAPATVRNPRYPSPASIGAGDCLGFVLSVFMTAAWRLEKRELDSRDIRNAISVAVGANDNFQHSFTEQNKPRDTFRLVIAAYLRTRRPWWKHPRWHIWHWQIQWHFGQRLARFLFSRCAQCGKRFSWGYTPVGSWNGTGPRRFRGERGAYHHECHASAPTPAGRAAEEPNPNV